MTMMLASINSIDESLVVCNTGADIIDLKDPAAGALGALDVQVVEEIVNSINGYLPVSATIGDVPYETGMVLPKILAMHQRGVDIVKVGVFGNIGSKSVLRSFTELADDGIRIVLVIFAEDKHALMDIGRACTAGIYGIMLDTREKSTGTLRSKLSDESIFRFVTTVKSSGLLCGLAGSLAVADIPVLLDMDPDYLGFRGALCHQDQRTNRLCKDSITRIRSMIPEHNGRLLQVEGTRQRIKTEVNHGAMA